MVKNFIDPNVNILIVEDDRGLRKYLYAYFKKRGIKNVWEASSGSQAIEICSQKQINFIISDWNMPNTSGIELLESIRSVGSSYGDIPFMMITVARDKKQIRRAAQVEVDDYLVKPFRTNLLEERFDKVLIKKMFDEFVKLAYLMLEKREFEKAREKFFKAYLQRKSDTMTLCGLTICNIELGHINNAKNYYVNIIDTDETEILLYTQALIESATGKSETAIATLNKTIEKYPNFLMAYLKIMEIHLKYGEYSAAKKIRETIENIKVSNTYDFKVLNEVY